jgi:membrane protein required for colicin V production
VDAVVLAFLLYGLIRGSIRGFSGELARLLYLSGALLGTSLAHPILADLLSHHTRLDATDADRIGLILAAGLAILLVLLIRLLVKKLFQFSFRGKLERVGGALLGLMTVFILVSAVFILAARTPWPGVRSIARSDSLTGRTANHLFPPLYKQMARWVSLPPLPPESGGEADPAAPDQEVWDPPAETGEPGEPEEAAGPIP